MVGDCWLRFNLQGLLAICEIEAKSCLKYQIVL
jgi:hypothetical protein